MEGARRLVVNPMRAAGFDYEPPQLGWDILANVNHYPSLVQVFCKELLNGLHRRKMLQNSGPRWAIDRKTVFEGSDYQQIAESIRRKFLLTLSLDPRYELVANVLALFRITDGDEAVLRRGIDVPRLFEEVEEFWPENLQRLDRNAFTGLLDEMVDLGVLSRLGSKRNRYGLRTSHVAQMLGTEEEIEDTIQQLMDLEPRVDYDTALYCRPIRIGNPMQRSPFSDQQLTELFNLKNPDCQIVAATAILGIESAVEALEAIAPDWHKEGEPRREVGVVRESDKQFRRVLSRFEKRGRHAIVIVAPAAKWDEQWLEYAAKQKGVQSGVVRPIFVANGVWLRERILASECELPWKVITPRPWGHQMLRAHLDETEGVMLDHKELRQCLLNGSGGAPERLVAACAELQEQYRNGSRDLERAVGEWAVEQAVSLEEVGLDESFGEIVDTLDDCLPEEIPVLREIWKDARHALTLNLSVRLFSALGLLDPVDPNRKGIRFTKLGRLLKRSL